MTTAEELAGRDYANPTRSCDVVMKGGITSGVVYPHAVCELAQTYRFRNVGGTSAGAIAAAATAAAEYGRAGEGFAKLARLPGWIGSGKNLQRLFQPQRPTRKLHAVMIAKVGGSGLRAAAVALWKCLPAALVGALPGLVLLALAVFGGDAPGALTVAAVAAGVLLAVLGLVAGVLVQLGYQLLRAVPDNRFGICSGGPGAGPDDAKPLTPWLADLLNDAAGLPAAEPLTFGHLWAKPGEPRIEAAKEPREPHLRLAMMTTNLTNRRAHQLPWGSGEWFFKPAEFRALFPAEVVDWMVEHARKPQPPGTAAGQRSRMRRALFPDLVPMPEPSDLPVVVATRMSLSFPILLSAVPLWCVDMTNPANGALDEWRDWAETNGAGWDPLASDRSEWPRAGQPQKDPIAEPCWFSDGGISSNFPVHFFDGLVPRWPTFAINLRPFPLGRELDERDQAANVEMAKANGDGIKEWWYRFSARPKRRWWADKRLFEFLSAAVRTMQNRADEAQMRVPGYRDRVAHVNMDGTEGGMNLTMPEARIAALTERGRIAAGRLRDAYTPPDVDGQRITWDNHRWARLRSSLGVLEEMHERFAAGYSTAPEQADERTYAELLDPGTDPPSYEWVNAEQATLAVAEVEAIVAAAALSDERKTVLEDAPKPTPQGRIAPRD